MAKGIKRSIYKALDAVHKEIADNAAGGSIYAKGLASESYAGGYEQALSDILLLLNGTPPNTRDYWEHEN